MVPYGNHYVYVSHAVPEDPTDSSELPPLSTDGGNEAEFEHYWIGNRHPKLGGGGWVERVAHPQVNVEHYWYQASTGQTVWTMPIEMHEATHGSRPGIRCRELKGDGPA